jgi:hypothetical protein
VTAAPGIAALLSHGVVPIAILPRAEGAPIGKDGVTVRFSFPVAGGRLNARQLSATIDHQGGIVFVDPATGEQIAVSSLIIGLRWRLLAAIVSGNSRARVALLTLSLAIVRIQAGLKFQPGLRAVVLSGEGPDFCAGLDFASFQAMRAGERLSATAQLPPSGGPAKVTG